MTQRTTLKIKSEALQDFEDPLEDNLQTEAEQETETFDDRTNPLQQFIQTYEALPELWNPEHPWYLNKERRFNAYKQLLEVYVRFKPQGGIADVKKKINSLRSNYRKELKKIAKSERICSSQNVYKPTSWVFYELQFLDNVPENIKSKPRVDNLEETCDINSTLYAENEYVTDDETQLELEQTSPKTESQKEPKTKPHRIINRQSKQKKLKLSTTPPNGTQSFSFNQSMLLTETIPTIARVWGEKLVNLEPQQRNFAEKAINDILFEASQGTLNRHSVKINEIS